MDDPLAKPVNNACHGRRARRPSRDLWRSGAENDRLGDEFLGGVDELGVVVLVVGAHECVCELVDERLDLTVRGVAAWMTIAFVLGCYSRRRRRRSPGT